MSSSGRHQYRLLASQTLSLRVQHLNFTGHVTAQVAFIGGLKALVRLCCKPAKETPAWAHPPNKHQPVFLIILEMRELESCVFKHF